MNRIPFLILFLLFPIHFAFTQDTSFLIDFSGHPVNEGSIVYTGAPSANLSPMYSSFGNCPTDNAFVEATDGRGFVLEENSGSGLIAYTKTLSFQSGAVAARISVHASAPGCTVYLAVLDLNHPDSMTYSSMDSGSFVDKWGRMSVLYQPPAGSSVEMDDS